VERSGWLDSRENALRQERRRACFEKQSGRRDLNRSVLVPDQEVSAQLAVSLRESVRPNEVGRPRDAMPLNAPVAGLKRRFPRSTHPRWKAFGIDYLQLGDLGDFFANGFCSLVTQEGIKMSGR
jgi:hypothetical protein